MIANPKNPAETLPSAAAYYYVFVLMVICSLGTLLAVFALPKQDRTPAASPDVLAA
jgi:hypothetical protein